ncbi:ribonuclease HII [Dellaglioa sp. P0083]|uniref:ribonuclease HII n=1 Tax=Dellaglioa kimchii TaxID=3344667 RepID=UPI0038D45683
MTKFTISQVKEHLLNNPSDNFMQEIAKDSRKGVIKLLIQYNNRQKKLVEHQELFNRRLVIERDLWQNGIPYIAGIDEVGRGPLAGPVVSASVILPHNFNLIDVNDSKKLSASMREALYVEILATAVSVGISVINNQTIDEVNIYQASRIAMLEAVNSLDVKPQQLLIDAMTIDSDIPQKSFIKGDSKSASIAAASIVAKVYRDHLMNFYNELYPGYDFNHNDGYGTKKHLAGLSKLGVTPIHRRTFEPIKSMLKK